MSAIRLRRFFFVVNLIPVMSLAAVGPLEWTNPIVPQRADPHVTLQPGGMYYLAATVPEYDRIELRRAPTLAGLSTAEPVVIWRKHDSGPMSVFIWAPEFHRIDGKWYVYFAATNGGDIGSLRMYVLENSSPDPFEGKWTEKGQIQTNWESFSLDATTFEHRGRRYLVWAQSDPKIPANSNLYIARMNTPWSIVGEQAMIATPDLPWERIGHAVVEGAAVITDETPNSIVLNIDPAVFVDDDGQDYLFWGSWNAGRWVKLKDNMIELEGEVHDIAAHNFFESPWIHKKDGVYYLTYAAHYPSTIEYSTSKSIEGPWKYRGVINDRLPVSETNHQGIVEFKGNWYFVYHNAGLPGGGVYRRSVCVDKLEYNKDSSIRKVGRTETGPLRIE